MHNWITTQVVAIKRWHAGLFSLTLDCPDYPFKAGQFTRIGLRDGAGEIISRAYSMVNAPSDNTLELVIAMVPEGVLTPRLALLEVGDEVVVSQHPSGFFTLDHVPQGDTLWMLATGTGIGPYLSILKTPALWQRFNKVRLVHGVRTLADLCYADWLNELAQQHSPQFKYQAVVSRESNTKADILPGRIPALIESGALEHKMAAVFNGQAQVMLCGNPGMIQDARAALQSKGLEKHLRRKPGNVTMEQYWS